VSLIDLVGLEKAADSSIVFFVGADEHGSGAMSEASGMVVICF